MFGLFKTVVIEIICLCVEVVNIAKLLTILFNIAWRRHHDLGSNYKDHTVCSRVQGWRLQPAKSPRR